jgi:hypothetical protein
MNEFLSVYLILPAALSTGVYSASNRNEYHNIQINFLGSRAWPVAYADKLNVTCEPTV